MNEPWDSENNKKLVEKMPPVFAPPRGRARKGETFYQMFGGSHGALKAGKDTTMAQFADGLSNTFLIVEGAKPVIWTKPDDLTFDGQKVPELGGSFDGMMCAVFGDGAVYRIKKGGDPETMRRLICPNDGEPVDVRLVEDNEKK